MGRKLGSFFIATIQVRSAIRSRIGENYRISPGYRLSLLESLGPSLFPYTEAVGENTGLG